MSDDPYRVMVSFGDCDPAGIVYYPNILAWVDGAFHHHLRAFGGHKAICARLGSAGLGAVDVKCRFKRPMRDGDTLEILLIGIEWSEKTYTLSYEGRAAEGVTFECEETRGVFVGRGEGLSLAPNEALRRVLTGGANG